MRLIPKLVWFRRNDIGGTAEPLNTRAENWQVIDATPQEVSHNGRYELGPTLVAGIRSGDLSITHDMGFVYSEVNSDVVFWYMGRNGQYYKKSVATNSIGTVLMTKGPDGQMIDLTENYKYREGTSQERNSFKRAKSMVNLKYSRDLDDLLTNEISDQPSVDDVPCKVTLQDRYRLGAPIDFSISLVNNLNATRSVFLKLTLDSIYYNGKLVANVVDKIETITLAAGEGEFAFWFEIFKLFRKLIKLINNQIILEYSPEPKLQYRGERIHRQTAGDRQSEVGHLHQPERDGQLVVQRVHCGARQAGAEHPGEESPLLSDPAEPHPAEHAEPARPSAHQLPAVVQGRRSDV